MSELEEARAEIERLAHMYAILLKAYTVLTQKLLAERHCHDYDGAVNEPVDAGFVLGHPDAIKGILAEC